MKDFGLNFGYNQSSLNDFCEEFSETPDPYDKFVIHGEDGDENLIRLYRNGKFHFKNRKAVCPDCKSSKNVAYGERKRTLSFFTIGTEECLVQLYECEECGKVFEADLSSLIYSDTDVTYRVKDKIERVYRLHNIDIPTIQHTLKIFNNIEISLQTIEKILDDEI